MKRYIRSSEGLPQRGFLFTMGKFAYFLASDEKNITDKIARKFINAVCDKKSVGDSIRRSALYDPATLKDFKKRIDHAELAESENDWGKFYSIKGKGFSLNFPEEDFRNKVVLI